MKRQEKNHKGRIIMGMNCIKEVFRSEPSRIIKICTSKIENDAFIKELKNSGIAIQIMDRKALTHLVSSDSHQGMVAYVHERRSPSLKEFLSQEIETSLILMLDSIEDPQNFGAILRAAECFGVNAVVWSKNRGVSITPVVSKVSVGASELIPLIKVSNLAEAVKEAQKQDYVVATAELDDTAIELHQFTRPPKLLLVLGSEGKGVQPLISKRADVKLTIPMQGNIDSLNVSQATAVMLYHLTRVLCNKNL